MVAAELYEDTIAELLDRLGGIAAHRVLLKPTPGTATEEDVLKALAQPRKRVCELIDGTLVEKDMGTQEAILGNYLSSVMWAFVKKHNLGVVLGGDAAVQLGLGCIRCPDVSFIPWELAPENPYEKKIWPVTPLLAVEVLSESNTKKEMDRKLKELFSTGCQLVWIIDPQKRTAKVYASAKRFKELDESGVLDGGKILPGFKLSLTDLFAATSRPKKKPQ
jgi:Uma2 family endonuclease